MKSPILNKYESKLIEINDQLCFFLFSDAEIEDSLLAKSNLTNDSYTTEVFPDNAFSERLNIKIQALPAFREKAFHTLVSMIVIASIEYLLGYIKDIEKFRASVSTTDCDAISKEKAEEQLKEKLKCWSDKEPEKGIIKTIRYLRLRRNHIAHVKEEMSDGYKSLIKNDSHYLNKFWGERVTKLNDFDFSKKDHSQFSVDEIFALINLTRVCMRLIDEIVMPSIDHKKIIEYELPKFLNRDDLKRHNFAKRVRKFNTHLRSTYKEKIVCTENEYKSYPDNA